MILRPKSWPRNRFAITHSLWAGYGICPLDCFDQQGGIAMKAFQHDGKHHHDGKPRKRHVPQEHRHNGQHHHDGKPRKKHEAEKDLAASYERFKEFEGQRFTGMKVGRSLKWYYDKGEWKDKKITPDKWQISYAVTKRRAGRAPEGSGVPVGTEYHWFILAHQNTAKQTANDYTTTLTGLKFKIAHKRADTGKWSATPGTQRKRMITFLRSVLAELEKPSDR